MNVNSKAAVDALLTFTPSNWAQNYNGTWINSSVLFIQALQVDDWNQSSFQQSVALPQFVVSVSYSGGLTSQDGTSPPMSATLSGVARMTKCGVIVSRPFFWRCAQLRLVVGVMCPVMCQWTCTPLPPYKCHSVSLRPLTVGRPARYAFFCNVGPYSSIFNWCHAAVLCSMWCNGASKLRFLATPHFR